MMPSLSAAHLFSKQESTHPSPRPPSPSSLPHTTPTTKTKQAMVEKARESEDNAVKCLVDCLVSCLDSMAQYLNRWAFTYIGIYG